HVAGGGALEHHTPGGSVVSCNLGDIAPGGRLYDSFSWEVDDTALGEYTYSFSIQADECDPDPSNNSAGGTVSVRVFADLELRLQAIPPTTAAPGEPVTLYALITNNEPRIPGRGGATGVTFTDLLPPGSTVVETRASQGTCAEAGGIVT